METSTIPSNLVKTFHTLAAKLAARAHRMTARTDPSQGRPEESLHVSQLMTPNPRTCGPGDTLHHAAQIMWDNDCGCAVVIDADGRVSAMITDRDVCMAAYTRGRPLGEIPVSSAASRTLVAVHDIDTLETAESLMQQHRIRRLPVIDAAGRPVGILSMSDLVRYSPFGQHRGGFDAERVARILATICEPASRVADAE